MTFADELDGFVKEFLEKLEIEKLFEKVNSNPLIKLAGIEQASTMQLRNAVYMCAEKKEEKTVEFVEWIWQRLLEILSNSEHSQITLLDNKAKQHILLEDVD